MRLPEISKKKEKSAGLSSGKYVGLKDAEKSDKKSQFHDVTSVFSVLMSPWKTFEEWHSLMAFRS